MKTTLLLLATLLTVTTITTQAQTITGKLTDETNVPLEYANIV